MAHSRMTPVLQSPSANSQLQAIPYRPERCEGRLTVAALVTVLGFDTQGRIFHEMALTRNISRHGCCIHVHARSQPGNPLALRIVPRGGPVREDLPHLTYQLLWTRPVR